MDALQMGKGKTFPAQSAFGLQACLHKRIEMGARGAARCIERCAFSILSRKLEPFAGGCLTKSGQR
jgi:hypothetical protein